MHYILHGAMILRYAVGGRFLRKKELNNWNIENPCDSRNDKQLVQNTAVMQSFGIFLYLFKTNKKKPLSS